MTWINLEDIILNDISSHRRAILYNSTYVYEILKVVKIIEPGSRMVVAREWRRGKGSVVQWYKFPLSKLTVQSGALLDSNVPAVTNAALCIKNLYRVELMLSFLITIKIHKDISFLKNKEHTQHHRWVWSELCAKWKKPDSKDSVPYDVIDVVSGQGTAIGQSRGLVVGKEVAIKAGIEMSKMSWFG